MSSSFNGFNASTSVDSLQVTGQDAPPLVNAAAIRYNKISQALEMSNNGGSWLTIGAGPSGGLVAGSNIQLGTVGSSTSIATVSNPTFADVTVGSTSLSSIISTVNADLDQPVKTTSDTTFASVSCIDIFVPSLGHTHISDQNIQWPTGRLVFTQNITSAVEIGANSIYLKNIHSNGAGNLNLSDSMTCSPGVLIDGRDISADGATLDSTVTTVGTLSGYLNQAVKTTSSPTFVAVNTASLNSTTGMTNQQKFTNWICTDPYSSTGGSRLSLYADSGSVIGNNNRMGIITLGGATTTAHNLGNGAFIEALSTQAWSGTAQGTQLNFWTCPNNSTAVTKALTIDQDQSTKAIGSISWSNSTGTLTNSSTDPVIQSAGNLRLTLNGTEQATFQNDGTTLLRTLDAKNTGTGLILKNVVVSSTGTAVTGGLRMNGTLLEYYNGSSWSSSGSVVTAGTNMTFTGSALGTIGNPTFSGLITGNGGIQCSSSVAGTATLQGYNSASSASVSTLWAIAPNLTSGQKTSILHGVAGSTYNSGSLTFNYSGNGSAANSFGLGVFGNDNLLTVDATGNCNIVGNMTSGGTVKANSATNNVACFIGQHNSTIFGTQLHGQLFSPSLPAGSRTQIQFGQASSSNNCGLLDFNYVNSGSTSNSINLGLNSSNGISILANGQVTMTNDGSAATVQVSKMLAPNASSQVEMFFGKSQANYNCAVIDFNYAGSGLTNNTLGFGFYGANNKMTVDGLGNVVAANNMTSSSMYSNSASYYHRPASGNTSQDFFISSNTSDTTAYQISPITSTAIYIKSKTPGIPVNHQSWISGTATNTLVIDDNGSFANYFQVGTGKKALSGGLAMSSGVLQYYNGSAWLNVTANPQNLRIAACQVRVSNSGGTYFPTIEYVTEAGYSSTFGTSGSDLTSVDIGLPFYYSVQPIIVVNRIKTYCTPPSNIRGELSGGNTIRFIPSGDTVGDRYWNNILPNSGDYLVFTFIAQGY